MTREEAAALLELMRRQQRDQAPVPRLDAQAMAKCYVKIVTGLADKSASRPGRRSGP
jgi:hypothetical protein